jgi:hypothetical protein
MRKHRVTSRAGTHDAMQDKKMLAMKTKSKGISISISLPVLISVEPIVVFGMTKYCLHATKG